MGTFNIFCVLYPLFAICYSRTCTVSNPQTEAKPTNIYVPASFTPRTDWSARSWPASTCPRPFTNIKYITIHHTAGKQIQDLAAGKKYVKSVQDMHKDKRGWTDIGYHFLIDSAGNDYQGRPFYDDNELPTLKPTAKDPTQFAWPRPRFISGAHVGNHNSNNVGISVMGCFADSCKTTNVITRYDKTYTNLVQLVSYLCKYLGLDPAKGDTIRTHNSWSGATTECPGKINDLIVQIRSDAKATLNQRGLCIDYSGSTTGGQCKFSPDLCASGTRKPSPQCLSGQTCCTMSASVSTGTGGQSTGQSIGGPSGGVDIKRCDSKWTKFPSATLVPFTGTDPDPYDHNDPNKMGFCLFSIEAQSGKGDTSIAPNFKLKEFGVKDGDDIIRLCPKIVECVQAVRVDMAESLTVNSGYRSVKYNDNLYKEKRKKEPSKGKTSRHQSGTATDIKVAGITDSDSKMFKFAKSIICNCRTIFLAVPGMDAGLGLDVTNIHIDMRPKLKSGNGFTSWTYGDTIHGKTKQQWSDFIKTTWGECSKSTPSTPAKPATPLKSGTASTGTASLGHRFKKWVGKTVGSWFGSHMDDKDEDMDKSASSTAMDMDPLFYLFIILSVTVCMVIALCCGCFFGAAVAVMTNKGQCDNITQISMI